MNLCWYCWNCSNKKDIYPARSVSIELTVMLVDPTMEVVFVFDSDKFEMLWNIKDLVKIK
jgi:hypothetical protein